MPCPRPVPGRTPVASGPCVPVSPAYLLAALTAVLCVLGACSDDPVSEEPPPKPTTVEVAVTGTVTDTAGTAIGHAAAAVYEQGGMEALDRDSTATDGSYALSVSVEMPGAPDSLRLVADADGYEPQEARVALDVGEEEAVTLEQNLQLVPRETDGTEAMVSGTVTDAESGDPLPNATVSGRRPGGDSGGNPLFETSSDDSGDYEATFVVDPPPSEVIVTAGAEGYEGEETAVSFREEMSADFTLAVAMTEASASGTVTEAETGDPIESATVTGTRTNSGDALFETSTDAEGRYDTSFDVAEAPDGVTIAAGADGYERGETTVPFGEEIGADLSLATATTEASVTGTITSEETSDPTAGDPIGGATITGARAESGDMLFEATTDGSGDYEATYEVAGPPSDVTVTAAADGFAEADTTVAYEKQLTVDLSLAPATYEQVVSGTVTDDLGDPVPDADVQVTTDAGETVCEGSSQAFMDGDCVDSGREGSEPESYTVAADRVHLANQDVTVPFDDAENTDVELPREFYTITGNVVNEDGDAVSGQDVEVTFGNTVLTTTSTDASGEHSSDITFYGATDVENPSGDVVYPESEFYKKASVGFTAQNPSTSIDVGETTLEDKLIDASVEGNVSSSSGSALEGAEVNADGTEVSGSEVTNSQGNYVIDFASVPVREAPPSIDMSASLSGFEDETDTVSFESDMVKDFTLQEIVNNYTVDITVENKEDGSPLNDVNVGSSELNKSKMTGSDGNVLFDYEGINSDNITFTFEKTDFVNTDTTVSANTNHTFTKLLSPEAPDTYEKVIKRDVTTDQGDLVDDADVLVTKNTGETVCDVVSQAFVNGDCVDTGEVGNEPDSYNIDVDRVHLEDQDVNVPFGDAGNADVELPREFYEIIGSVLNEDNQAVSGQNVEITFDNSVLTSTSTDGNGEHSSDVTFYEVTDVEDPSGDVVYPESEFYKEASVGFTASDPNTTVDVGETTLLDKLITATYQGNAFDQETNEGISNISVQYTTDEGQSQTTTTDNVGDFDGSLEIAKRNEPSTVDLIVNEDGDQGFESKTVQEPFSKDIQRDVGLESLVNEVSFSLEPYDVRGNAINDLTFSVESPSGDVQTFPVENGEANITYEVEDVQEALKIWHDFGNNDKYNEVLMIREQNQGVPAIAQDNIVNNTITEGWSHGASFDTLSVAASELDGKQNLDAYLAEYSHETNVGTVNVNDSDAVELAFGRTDNLIYGYDEVNGIDKLRVLLFEYNVDNPDEDIDPEIINEQEDYLNQIMGNLTQHPKVFDYEIDRISDPSELDPYEDEDFENTLGVYNRNLANPSNGMGLEGNRFSTPSLNLPEIGIVKGVFIEEVTEGTAGMNQPSGYGGSSAFTVKVPGGSETAELNSFGETVYNLNLLLNKGTQIE